MDNVHPPAWTDIRHTTGLFAKYRSYRIADVMDGTSTTVAFSEGLVGGMTADSRGQNRWRNAVTGAEILPEARLFSALDNLPATLAGLQHCNERWPANQNIVQGVGDRWGWGDTAMTMFNTIVPPNSTQYEWHACRHGCAGCSADSAVYTAATSNHSGGCNVAFGDGSVRFIKNTISMDIWMDFGTRDGGEVISSDQF